MNNMSQYDRIRQISLYLGRSSTSQIHARVPSALFSNQLMTTTALQIARTASIPSLRALPPRDFVASFVISAMSLLMASLRDENMITIAL